jgi:hypothetical protein
VQVPKDEMELQLSNAIKAGVIDLKNSQVLSIFVLRVFSISNFCVRITYDVDRFSAKERS